MIHPIISYGDFIYDGGLRTNLSNVQIAQNEALRAVRKCKPDYSTKRLHTDLGIEMLDKSRLKSTVKMVFRGVHNQGPAQLNSMFNIYTRNRTLRSESQNLLLPPKCKTVLGDKDISVRGCIYWKQIEYNIHPIETLDEFKSVKSL